MEPNNTGDPSLIWYRKFFDEAGVGMAITDKTYRFIKVNDAFCKFLGYTKDELLTKTILEITHPDDLTKSSEKLAKQFAGAISGFRMEKRYLTKTGETVWGEVTSSYSVNLPGSDEIFNFAVIEDITKRKRLEEALKESESQYRTLFETSPDAIVLHAEGKILSANPAAVKGMRGTSEKDLVGKPVMSFVHSDYQEMIKERIAKMAKGIPAPLVPEKFIRLDGSIIDVETAAAPIVVGGKKAFQVVIHDMTERFAGAEKLKKSEESYRILAEASHDMIFVTDHTGTITYANSFAAAQFGIKPEQMIGKKRADFFGKTAETQDISLKKVFETGEPLYRETKYPFGEKILWLGTWLIPLKKDDGGVTSILGVSRDISAQKAGELELMKLNRTLKEGEASYKGLFDSVGEAIYIQDTDGKFLDVNPGAVKMYGYPREWFIGKSPLDVSAPGKNDLEKIKKSVEKAFAGEPQEFEFWGVKSNGEAFPKNVRLYKGTYFGKDVVIALATDITARKKAEDKLRESEERFRSLFTNMLDGFAHCEMIFDEKNVPVDFVYLDVNDRFEELTGLRNVVGKKVSEVIPGIRESNPELFEFYGRAAATGESGRLETYVPGLAIWFSISVYSPKKGHFVAVFSTITDRKKAEAELEKSSLQLRFVYEQTSDILYYMTVEAGGSYRFTSVNPAFYKATGLREDQVIGKLVTEIIPEPSLSLVLGKYKEAIEGKKVVAWEEVTPYPTGTKYGDVSVAPIFNGGGECSNLIGTVHDITDRKMAEETLIKEKAKLEAILNGIADGVFVVDDHGKIILFNAAAERITGLSFEAIKEKQYWEVLSFVPEGLSEAKADFIRSALAGKEENLEVNVSFRKATGKVVPILASAATLDGRGRQSIGIVVIFRDISKEREVQQLRDEFMMIASHELRAPMTAVKWLVTMMLEGSYGVIDEKLKSPLATIASSTDRLIHLVNDMINITRVEAGNLRLTLTDFDIKKMIDDLLVTFGSEAKKKNIQIDAVGVTSAMVQADPDWTAQILSNLIDNAIKFNHDGGRIAITIQKKDNESLNIAVVDTGLGIPDDFREKLFTKFAQVIDREVGKPLGTGLGLFISRELARGMGGDLWLAETTLGQGSTFVIKIPLSGSPSAGVIVANHKKKTG